MKMTTLRRFCGLLCAQAFVGVVMIAASSADATLPVLTLNGAPPLVLSHRGASGYLPEETMEAYQLALQLRSDTLEGDLWVSKDGVLVMRHDRSLVPTTNVVAYALTHPEIAALNTGTATNPVYNIDNFTFAQIQELTATRRNSAGYRNPNAYFDAFPTGYHFKVVSLNQLLDYVYDLYLTTGQIIPVEPEAKATGYEQQILDTFNDPKYNGFFDGHLNNVMLQSFNKASTTYWTQHTLLPALWLRSCPTTDADWSDVANNADGIGIGLSTRNSEQNPPRADPSPTTLALVAACVARAHQMGLFVQAYTFYDIPADYDLYLATGLDAVFTNFTDIAHAERNALFDSVPPNTVATPSVPPNAAGWNNANVTVALVATDNAGGSGEKHISYSIAGAQAGSAIIPGNNGLVTITAEGTTTITYFATDNLGNEETPKTLTLKIDKTGPTIAGLPSSCSLWPPNRKMVKVATVTANDGLSGLASFTVSGASNEPANVGESDIVITQGGVGRVDVQLRADRLGTGKGRVYTLTAVARDVADNTRTSTAICEVPHDQGK